MIAPGGVLQLPLFEYRDAVSDKLNSIGAVRLEPIGEQERLVNPGKAVVFNARLVNDLETAVDFNLNVTGVHADWSQVLSDGRISVPARSTGTIRLAVQAPSDAVDRDAADLVREAQDVSNPAVRTLLRLRATVDVAQDHLDESPEVASYATHDAKGSPGLEFPVVALALVVATLGLRRAPRRQV